MELNNISKETLSIIEVLKDLEQVREKFRNIVEERYGVKQVDEMMEDMFDGPYDDLRIEIRGFLGEVIDSNLLESNYSEI